MPKPIPISAEASAGILRALEERDIGWAARVQGHRSRPLGQDGDTARRANHPGTRCSSPYRSIAPRKSSQSRLSWKRTGWIGVDHRTFATKFDHVYAVGDVTSAPVPRVGAIAEGEASTLADVLIHHIRGRSRTRTVQGPRDLLHRVRRPQGGAVRRQLPGRRVPVRDVHRGIGGDGRLEGRVRLLAAPSLVRHGVLTRSRLIASSASQVRYPSTR